MKLNLLSDYIDVNFGTEHGKNALFCQVFDCTQQKLAKWIKSGWFIATNEDGSEPQLISPKTALKPYIPEVDVTSLFEWIGEPMSDAKTLELNLKTGALDLLTTEVENYKFDAHKGVVCFSVPSFSEFEDYTMFCYLLKPFLQALVGIHCAASAKGGLSGLTKHRFYNACDKVLDEIEAYV